MKFYTLIFTFFLINFVYPQNTNQFIIDGSIKGVDNGKIILKYDNVIDKQKIKNGKFKFTGSIDKTTKARFIYKRKKTDKFYLDSCHMKITLANKENFKADRPFNIEYAWNVESISGSLTNKLSKELKKYISENFESRVFNYMIYNYLNEKISQYPANYLFYDFLNNNSKKRRHLAYKQYLDLAKKLDLSYLTKEEKIIFLQNIDVPRKLCIGMKFPSGIIYNSEGGKEHISDHFKSMTIVNIWSLNGMVSSKENELFQYLYNKYRSKDLNFIAISGDDKTLENYKAIYGSKMKWKNYSSKEIVSKLNLRKNISSQNYLIDEDGYIIRINLTSNEIEKILSSEI